MCQCMCVIVCMCMCVRVHVCVSRVSACMYVCMYVCAGQLMRVSVYECVLVSARAHVVWISVSAYVCTQIRRCVQLSCLPQLTVYV